MSIGASWEWQAKPSLLDTYDYAMHGRIFSYEHKAGLEVEIVASFGGLLMSLKGDQSQLANLEMDQVVYLLMRKGGP